MKAFSTTVILLLFATNQIYSRCGELWFYIDDTQDNWYIKAERVNISTYPLFGENFMELGDNHSYDVVISDDPQAVSTVPPYDYLLGFDYLRDQSNHCWPFIGEGIIKFSIYKGYDLIITFTINLVHLNVSPDITFYVNPVWGYLLAKGNGSNPPTRIIYNYDSVTSWYILNEERNVTDYRNIVQLTNDVNGSVENDIMTTFNTAVMGFPEGNVQIGHPYDPGTMVGLWRGVNYNISTSHSTYTKNNIIYNFRNWIGYESYTTSSTLRVLDGTDEFRSMYYPTIPLTVANNLEGGSSNNDYEITWQTPPITQT